MTAETPCSLTSAPTPPAGKRRCQPWGLVHRVYNYLCPRLVCGSMVDLSLIQGFLFDLDGVFYVGDRLLEGGPALLARLREQRIPFRFVTNTTTSSRQQLQQKLRHLGIDTEIDELVTAPVVTRDYLLEQDLRRCNLIVGAQVMPDFAGIQPETEKPDAVVIGDIGDAWSYGLVDRLFNQIVGGARLVAMHRNRYWQKASGLHVDIGLFVAGLEYVSGVQAQITGKPAPTFFQIAAAQLGVAAERVAVVGDDIESDVGGAQAAGMAGILVQTGKYRQELAVRTAVTPDLVLASIAELGDRLGL